MLGFVILGLKDRQKTIGALDRYQCPDCHNTSTWHLIKTRTWLRVFFVPVLPLAGSVSYWRTCPVCGWSIEVADEEVPTAKATAKTSQETV